MNWKLTLWPAIIQKSHPKSFTSTLIFPIHWLASTRNLILTSLDLLISLILELISFTGWIAPVSLLARFGFNFYDIKYKKCNSGFHSQGITLYMEMYFTFEANPSITHMSFVFSLTSEMISSGFIWKVFFSGLTIEYENCCEEMFLM